MKQYECVRTIKNNNSIRTILPDRHPHSAAEHFLQLASYATAVVKEINVRQIQLSVQVHSPITNQLFSHSYLAFIIILNLSCPYENALFFTVFIFHVFISGSPFFFILAAGKVHLATLFTNLPQHCILAITPRAADLSGLVSHFQFP